MSTRHREFASARAELAENPITFSLDEEVFTVEGVLQAGPLLDLITALPGGLDTDKMAPADAMVAFKVFGEFIEGVVIEPDRERWRAAMRTTTLQTVMDILAWVIEESTGRPLVMSSGSEPSASEPSGPLRSVSLKPVGEPHSA